MIDSMTFVEKVYANESLKVCLAEMGITNIVNIKPKKAKSLFGAKKMPFLVYNNQVEIEGLEDMIDAMSGVYQDMQRHHEDMLNLPQQQSQQMPDMETPEDMEYQLMKMGHQYRQQAPEQGSERRRITESMGPPEQEQIDIGERPIKPIFGKASVEELDEWKRKDDEYLEKLRASQKPIKDTMTKEELYRGVEMEGMSGISGMGSESNMESFIEKTMRQSVSNPRVDKGRAAEDMMKTLSGKMQ
jgi:hypothetical protein